MEDTGAMNLRRPSLPSPIYKFGFGFNDVQSFSEPFLHRNNSSSVAGISQLLNNFSNQPPNFGGSLPIFHPHPQLHPPHLYSSLPAAIHNGHHQPPLLPLPLPLLLSSSSPSNPIACSNNNVRLSRNNKNKKKKKKQQQQAYRPSTSPAKEPEAVKVVNEPVEVAEKKVTRSSSSSEEEEGDVEEEFLIVPSSKPKAEDSVYSLSPPPSSLPFPKLLLRQKAAAGSCVAEAKAGVEADDLLLRLLKL